MSRREQNRRHVLGQQPHELALGGLGTKMRGDLPAVRLGAEPGLERLQERLHAHVGRPVAWRLGAEESDPARPGSSPRLGPDDGHGIGPIFRGRLEVQPPHGVGDVEPVLEFKRDPRGRTHDQQVEGEPGIVGRARDDLVSLDEFLCVLHWLIGVAEGELFVEIVGLRLAVIE